jgi:hypothetical protein
MQNPEKEVFAIVLMIAMTTLWAVDSYGQSVCPTPETMVTVCSGSCTVPGGTCEYTTTFSTNFTGNNKYATVTIYANGQQILQECLGPFASGTRNYAISYTAPCASTISVEYVAFTSSSSQNPCGGSSCDQGYCAGGSCQSGLLPITLKSFEGRTIQGRVLLEWVTSSEQDNHHFRIERSQDGIQWQMLTKVAGSGNSYTEKSYQWTDNFPLPGPNYYRLVQVDHDGTEHPFRMISLEPAHPVFHFDLQVQDKLIQIAQNLKENVRITILDLQGKPLLHRELLPGSSTTFDDLNSGMYILHLRSPEISYTDKMIIP